MTERQATFGMSCIVLQHRYKGNFLYYESEGTISRVGLSFIFEEEKNSKITASIGIIMVVWSEHRMGLPLHVFLLCESMTRGLFDWMRYTITKGYISLKNKVKMVFCRGMVFRNV